MTGPRTASSRVGGWALLYAPLSAWWWPAAPLVAVLALTARYRLRSATGAYARLLEAAARLHATDLAIQLGIDQTGPLDSALGDALTHQLNTCTPSPPTSGSHLRTYRSVAESLTVDGPPDSP
ncbi:hypothetical protein [Streptomyces sp. NBC_00162]|uniref:hypothetical protein n=1 Tax=Streptomyces sp. NBC_00162 TaxID=2903629 RepID=UPI00214B7A58|nr:hypothetical protein [Streptomyces sp. NBC_00162]UUU44137.1 hypothetical protein JIW86_38380 [Streptomyces sp. NBC_00162]